MIRHATSNSLPAEPRVSRADLGRRMAEVDNQLAAVRRQIRSLEVEERRLMDKSTEIMRELGR
jgi:hypothetical protein